MGQFELFNKNFTDAFGRAPWDNGIMPNHSSEKKRPVDFNQLAASIVGDATTDSVACVDTDRAVEPMTPVREKLPAAVELGRRGGLEGGPARAKKLTAEEMAEIGKRAAKARWGRPEGEI